MPRVLDPHANRDAVTAAVAQLIVEGGLPAASLRAVARRSRVSTGVLVENWGGRDRMMRLSGLHLGRQWHEALWTRFGTAGLAGLLPRSEEERHEARIWLAFCELARDNEQVHLAVAELHAGQRRMLDTMTDRRWSEADLDLLCAVVDGLRHSVCTPGSELTLERAATALQTFLAASRTLAPDPCEAPLTTVGE